MSLESAFELLYGTQIMTRTADEHSWHLDPSTPPVSLSEIVPLTHTIARTFDTPLTQCQGQRR